MDVASMANYAFDAELAQDIVDNVETPIATMLGKAPVWQAVEEKRGIDARRRETRL
jgi:hypothetical protein